MKRGRWLLVLMLLSGIGLGSQPEQEPIWLSDLEAARMAARDSGRPIFAVIRCRH